MGKIHSVAICKKETFEQWKRGELLCFDGVLLSPIDCVSSTTKVAAKKLYIKNQDEFQKDWADLSNEAKEKCYVQYVMKHDTSYCENGETYEEYINGDLDMKWNILQKAAMNLLYSEDMVQQIVGY